MEQANSKGFYQNAMQYGTYLGIFWAMTYILLFKFPTNPIVSTMAMTMYFGSPFFACRLATVYRRKECNDNIKYPQAWTFLFFMYLCATLFSAMTNYIFFHLIDQGAFLMDFNDILSQIISAPDIEETAKMQFEQIQDALSQLTTKEIVWQLFNNNIFSSLALPPVIALFLKKQQKI
jgi:hypothetical protein